MLVASNPDREIQSRLHYINIKTLIFCLILLFSIPSIASAQTGFFDDPNNVKEYISEYFGPKMVAVIHCESHFNQYDPSGNVLTHRNKNGTIDYGIFQINSVHLKEAEVLGLDLNKPEDNISFAKWMYFNEKLGDKPWMCSSLV